MRVVIYCMLRILTRPVPSAVIAIVIGFTSPYIWHYPNYTYLVDACKNMLQVIF